VSFLRDALVDGCIEFMKGCDDSFRCVVLQRGVTHTMDTTIIYGDLWSPYKRTRVNNQGRKI
jgi:hypothetical protein